MKRSVRFAAGSLVSVLLMVACLAMAERSHALGTFVPVKQRLPVGTLRPMTLTLPDGRILIAGGTASIYLSLIHI